MIRFWDASRLGLFKLLDHVHQQLPDGQVLGTDALTLAAADAVRCLAARPGGTAS